MTTETSFSRVVKHWVAWLPIAGTATFVALYFYAASLYPGGTRVDHHTSGYSHFSNYWCDLFTAVSYSGGINRGRPFAVLATIIFPLSLVPLWILVPALFHADSRLKRLVQIVGTAAMLCSTMIYASIHDAAINAAAILGFVALGSTVLGLRRKRYTMLIGLALVATVLGVTNFLMWHTRWFLGAMPTVQKLAFVAFFTWIIATSRAVHRNLGEAPSRPSSFDA